MQKLSVKGLALACGIVWSFAMIFSIWAAIFGWCVDFVNIISSIYIGVEPTFIGGIIGAVYGFFDGAICGAIIAFIYNQVVKKQTS